MVLTMDEGDEPIVAGDDAGPEDQAPWRKGWIMVDPEKPLYGKVHACVLLRKVNDAMNGDRDAMPALDNEYDP
jgi:hypothetical protein